MAQSSQKLIRSLFGLQSEEQIFEDFAGALQKGVLWQGRLFLTENYICFYSNILNKKKKVAIRFDQIEKIEKKKTLGMIPNQLEITTSEGLFKFTSIYKRSRAYKMMIAIWHSKRPDLFDEEEELDDEADDDDDRMRGYSDQMKNEVASNGSGSFQMLLETGAEQEEASKDAEEQKTNSSKKMPEESNIEVMLRNEGKGQQAKVVFEYNFPFSVPHFFQNFLADDAKFGIDKHFTVRGDRKVNLDAWKESEDGSQMRVIHSVMSVTGVPFKSETRLSKTYILDKQDDWILVYGCASTPDLPYSDTFNVEDKWEVKPREGGGCQLTVQQWATFHKSTMFRNKIEGRSYTDTKKDYENWFEEVKKRKLHQNPEAQSKPGLSHQLEEAEDFNLHRKEDEDDTRPKLPPPHPAVQWAKKNWSIITIAVLSLVVVQLLKVLWRVQNRLWELEALMAAQ